jgi:hypothetical protein
MCLRWNPKFRCNVNDRWYNSHVSGSSFEEKYPEVRFSCRLPFPWPNNYILSACCAAIFNIECQSLELAAVVVDCTPSVFETLAPELIFPPMVLHNDRAINWRSFPRCSSVRLPVKGNIADANGIPRTKLSIFRSLNIWKSRYSRR